MPTDILGISFAVFVAIGGIIGAVKAGSTQSLVYGLVFGLLIGGTSHAAATSASRTTILAPLLSCLALGIIMGKRYSETQKFMPGGLISAASLLMTLRFAAKYIL
ncbi:Transmembrane protein 14C [Linderina macrospora]|uniref:Transmembrane protein 14C n=1 Tax=Linderina macrospora TaxID=4868 RepID=A0ACC1J726_9FUNG|nr:Transmembrane protein 14C [Linderina macrospora]